MYIITENDVAIATELTTILSCHNLLFGEFWDWPSESVCLIIQTDELSEEDKNYLVLRFNARFESEPNLANNKYLLPLHIFLEYARL